MHKTWVAYDNLGLLVHFGMLPREIALAMFYDSAIKCWTKLEPHIAYEEVVRKSWYQIYFREFVYLSRQYALKLARQKYLKLKIASIMGRIGKARVFGLEVRGQYEKLGLTNDSRKIQNRLNNLRQIVFLDRDGTINEDCTVTYRDDQFKLIDGVKEGLQKLGIWGFDLVVVTNQSGISRGDYREEDMLHFNDLIIRELAHIGLSQSDFYFCPHNPEIEVCNCHKPNPGMLFKSAKDRSIDLRQSYLIGDKMSDILAGQRAGCKKTILVRTGITDDEDKYNVKPDYIARNLLEAARIIANVEGIT
jgi:D-glycero-D-manno-heptose 1,7-bisphosphate phosphatase